MSKEYPGSFFRVHKKSLNAKRTYFRLMSKDITPIKNIPSGIINKPINADLIDRIEPGVFKFKDGIEIIDRRNNKK